MLGMVVADTHYMALVNNVTCLMNQVPSHNPLSHTRYG